MGCASASIRALKAGALVSRRGLRFFARLPMRVGTMVGPEFESRGLLVQSVRCGLGSLDWRACHALLALRKPMSLSRALANMPLHVHGRCSWLGLCAGSLRWVLALGLSAGSTTNCGAMAGAVARGRVGPPRTLELRRADPRAAGRWRALSDLRSRPSLQRSARARFRMHRRRCRSRRP